MKTSASTSATIQTTNVQSPVPGRAKTRAMRSLTTPWAMAFALLLGAAVVPARADINWDGDYYRGNFDDCDNWYGNSCPGWSGNQGNLYFSYRNNGSQTSQYYNLGAWHDVTDIHWDSSWPVDTTWDGDGTGLHFNQKLQNDSSHTMTLGSMKLTGAAGTGNSATQIELNPVHGDMVINGNIYNDNARPYFVYASDSKMLTINTGLGYNTSPGSVSLTIDKGGGTGAGKVKFTAAQGWGDSTHGVTVKQGELWIDTGSLLAGIPIAVGQADANTAKLWLSVAGGGTTFPQNITVANSGGTKGIGGLNTSGTHTFTGNITLNGPVNLVADQSGGTVEFKTGVISGGSSVNINNTATSAGKVTLSGANTYSGDTTINGGTLQLGASNVIPDGSGKGNVVFNPASGTATLDVNGKTETINGLSSGGAGSSVVDNSTGTGSLTVGGNNANSTFGGVIKNTSGSLALTKVGTGTLTLSGVNTYSGGTTVSAGNLYISIGSVGTLGSASGPLTVSGTITTLDLGWTSQSVGTVTIAGGTIASGTLTGSSYAAQSGTVRAVLAGSGVALTKTTADPLNLWGSANNTYSGLTTVNAGTLNLGMTTGTVGLNAFGGDLTINGGTVNYQSGTKYDNEIPDTANVTLNGGTLDFGARNETIGQASPAAGSFTMSGGTLKAGGGTLTLARSPSISGGTIQVSSTGTSTGEVAFNADLTLSGATLDMTAVGTLVTGYRLQGGEGMGITYPVTGTATANFNNSGPSTGARLTIGPSSGSQTYTTVFNIADAPSVDPELSVNVPLTMGAGYTGNIRKDGAGKMTITVAPSSSFNPPQFIINGGTLALSGAGALPNVPTLQINGGATFDVSGLSSTLTLGTSQTLKGPSTVATGTINAGATVGLTLGSTTALALPSFAPATPALTVTGGALALAVGNPVTVTVANGGTALAVGSYKLISKGTGGTVAGTASTSVTVNGDGKAANTTASLRITSGELWLDIGCNAPTTANAGSAQTQCETSTATLAGNTPMVGTGTWTLVGGSGTITTPSSPTSGVTGLGYGINTFRWTIHNPSCTDTSRDSTSDVTITRYQNRTTASVTTTPLSVCGLTSDALGGNTPSVGSGAWSKVSGPGNVTFSAGTSGSSTATVDTYGTYGLRWTISNGTCTPSTADVTVNFYQTPSAPTAGSDSPVLPGATLHLTASTVTGATYAWTGPSGFTSSAQNPTIANVTRAANAGQYSVTATVNGCTSAAGTTSVTVNTPPTAEALTLAVEENGSATFPLAKYASDPDGDSLTPQFSSFNNGGSAAYASGTVTYTPANNFTGTETFNYTATDPSGASSASVTVTATVSASTGSGANILGFTKVSNTATVTYAGIPGTIYSLQYTVPSPISWQDVSGISTTDAGGRGTLTDSGATDPSRWYRTKYVSGP